MHQYVVFCRSSNIASINTVHSNAHTRPFSSRTYDHIPAICSNNFKVATLQTWNCAVKDTYCKSMQHPVRWLVRCSFSLAIVQLQFKSINFKLQINFKLIGLHTAILAGVAGKGANMLRTGPNIVYCMASIRSRSKQMWWPIWPHAILMLLAHVEHDDKWDFNIENSTLLFWWMLVVLSLTRSRKVCYSSHSPGDFLVFLQLVPSFQRSRASIIHMHGQPCGRKCPRCHCFHPERPPTPAAAQVLHGSVVGSAGNTHTSVRESLVLQGKQAGGQAWAHSQWTTDGCDITPWQAATFTLKSDCVCCCSNCALFLMCSL